MIIAIALLGGALLALMGWLTDVMEAGSHHWHGLERKGGPSGALPHAQADDGLTTDERAVYAERWRSGAGAALSAEEVASLREDALHFYRLIQLK